MAGKQLDKTLTALAGEFLVAGHLCLKGIVASLTLKNYPAVDIFALDPLTQKQVSIQVKTTRVGPRYSGAFFIPEKVDERPDQPFVFVVIGPKEVVDYYIMPGSLVASVSEKERQDYLAACTAKGRLVSADQPRMINLDKLGPFKNTWNNLGLGDLE